VDSIRTRLLDPGDRSVLVVSHRGEWSRAKENSVESIEAAIALGADVVEIDVRRVRGGELILNHDWVRVKPRGATSLEEALLAAKGKIMVNIDKAFPEFDSIVRIAERTGTLDHLIFKSGMPAYRAAEVMGEYAGKVIFMPVIGMDGGGALAGIADYLNILNPPVFELVFANGDNPSLTIVAALLEGRSRIWVNTMWPSLCGGHDDAASLTNPEEGYGWLIDKVGAGAIQTDRTAFLVDYLKKR
jgi:glycerophosphoryl diester phosphodiesterase